MPSFGKWKTKFLRYTRRPEVGAPNAISKQEMQAISRYAKERNIEISPLVQGLGHAGFILKRHWELRKIRIVTGSSVLPTRVPMSYSLIFTGMRWKPCLMASIFISVEMK